jgi:hypothetical protein
MYSYINYKNIPALRAFFPNMRLEELDAGHWGISYNIELEFRWLILMLFSTRGEAQRVPETSCRFFEGLILMKKVRSIMF